MTAPAKLSLKGAIKAMNTGARVMVMTDPRDPDGRSWFVVPGGRVSQEDARRIIARDDIVSSADGLFKDTPQTYRNLKFVGRE